MTRDVPWNPTILDNEIDLDEFHECLQLLENEQFYDARVTETGEYAQRYIVALTLETVNEEEDDAARCLATRARCGPDGDCRRILGLLVILGLFGLRLVLLFWFGLLFRRLVFLLLLALGLFRPVIVGLQDCERR